MENDTKEIIEEFIEVCEQPMRELEYERRNTCGIDVAKYDETVARSRVVILREKRRIA